MGLVLHEATPPLTRLGEVPVERFLSDFWQRQPCLLRQVFPGFEPELDANDVAGLACEEEAESRLVTGRFPQHDWTVRYGPFDEDTLRQLPERDWTLLVQDVEKHYPPLRWLLARFGFLPSWRLDDLMVSVAAPGGSVGPHVDRYDVFLLQASGRRRWDLARRFDPACLPGTELRVLQRFEPEEGWILEPGDVLYLPPGVAHHGVALDTGMTWSIGLRAPSQADLFLALGEWLATGHGEGECYDDAPGLATAAPGEVDAAARERLRALLAPAVDLDPFFGAFLTTYRLARPPEPARRRISAQRLERQLGRGAILRRNPWTRLAWIEGAGGATLFAAGQAFPCSAAQAELLCAGEAWRDDGSPLAGDFVLLLAELVNQGHLKLN